MDRESAPLPPAGRGSDLHDREPPWLTVFGRADPGRGSPLYITFVASTLTLDEIISVPMPLVPGTHLWENYSQVLTAGTEAGAAAPVGA
jgi:hypothetical protein